MKMKARSLGLTALCVVLMGAKGCTTLTTVLEAAVVSSTAAISVCPTLGTNASACLDYAEAVNVDAQKSLPISEDTTLTTAQISLRLTPIWANVATITFPNNTTTIAALQAAVAAVIQLIEQYGPVRGVTQHGAVKDAGKHLKLNKKDLDSIRVRAAANLAQVASERAQLRR